MADTGPFADAALAEFVAQAGAGFSSLDVATLRAGAAQRAQARARGPELAAVTDLMVAGRPARWFRPVLDAPALVVYLHGGGWTIGSLATHDRVCRRLAHASGMDVLALDYRLAPEHPWPAAVDDTVAALRWLTADPPGLATGSSQPDAARSVPGSAPRTVAVAGDSAGGTLAALACLRLRHEDPAAMPALQVLICANTDLTGDHPSMVEKGSGFGLDADAVRFFYRQWVPDPARRSDPAVSPLRAPDLSGLPPALIVTAEHDPLRDEAEAYAARLRAAGVPVELRREPGLIHNFVMLDEVSPACAAASDRIAADLRALLSGRS